MKKTSKFIGDDSANAFYGGLHRDIMEGNGGDDILVGAGGDDRLSGGDGQDVLRGGDGVDVLDGGAGSDVLTIVATKSGSIAPHLQSIETIRVSVVDASFAVDLAQSAGVKTLELGSDGTFTAQNVSSIVALQLNGVPAERSVLNIPPTS